MSGLRLRTAGNRGFDSFFDVGHSFQFVIVLDRIKPKDSKLAECFSVAWAKTTRANLGGSVDIDHTGIIGEAVCLQFRMVSPRPLRGNLVCRGFRGKLRMGTIDRRVDTVEFSQSTLPQSLILTIPPICTSPAKVLAAQYRFTCPQKSIHQMVAWKRLSFDNGCGRRV